MPTRRLADGDGPIDEGNWRYRVTPGPVSPDLFEASSGRRHLWLLGVVLAAIAAVYTIVALSLPVEVFWSPDEGAKLLQAMFHRPGGARADSIPYGGRGLDPDLMFDPRLLHPRHPAALQSALYPQPTADGGVRFHWPVAFPIASMVPYRAFGSRGLYLIPLVGGLIAAVAAGALGRAIAPAAAAPAALAVGLASPVLFYSQLFWEHAPAAALCLIGVLAIVRPKGPVGVRLVGAAVALAAAVALRPESLLLVAVLPPALALMVERRPGTRIRPRRAWWVLATGAFVFTLVVIGLWPNGREVVLGWVQAKALAARSLLAFVARASDLLSPFPSRLTAAWFDLDVELGPALPLTMARLGTVGALIALAAAALREPFRGWAIVAGGGLVLVPSLWVVFSPEPYRAVHALILPAPYLILAVALIRPPPAARRPAATLLGLILFLYLALGTALAMTKMVGGLEWGNRYLLPLTALGAVVAAVGAVTYGRRDGERRPRLAVIVVAMACLVTGALYQLRGVRELVITKRALEVCRQEVLETDGPVVTDLYWMPAAIAGTFAARPVFTLGDRDDLGRWVERVGRHFDHVRLITGDDGPDEIRRWVESVPGGRLRLVGTRTVPGLLIADVDVVETVDGRER